MCIKLIGLFTETLVCVIVNDPLVLFITFLMYTVLLTHVFVDKYACSYFKQPIKVGQAVNRSDPVQQTENC
jgi:type IV secretory pathway VirB3-like protein